MGFEAGSYMVRSAMLERSVDTSIREIRLSNNSLPDFVSYLVWDDGLGGAGAVKGGREVAAPSETALFARVFDQLL